MKESVYRTRINLAYVMPTESEREKVEVALECIGGPSKWKNKVTGMSGEEPGKCLGTCIAITDPPKGVAIIMVIIRVFA